VDVQEHEVRLGVFDFFQGRCSVFGFVDDAVRETSAQGLPQGRAEQGVIVYDEGSKHYASIATLGSGTWRLLRLSCGAVRALEKHNLTLLRLFFFNLYQEGPV